jgi:hypothetical protein
MRRATLRVLTGLGAAATAMGAIQVRASTPPCKNFDLKVQFAASDQRLAQWLGSCPADLDAVKRALRWDFLLLTGYGLLGGGVIGLSARRPGGLPAGLAVLPVLAAASDVVEDVLLYDALQERQGRLAFPIGSSRPAAVTAAASVKFLCLGLTVLVVASGLVRGRRSARVRPHRQSSG